MKNIFTIVSVAVLALASFGSVKAENERCPTVIQGFTREAFVFEKNLAQDYCSQFRKGPRKGELKQADGTQILTGICSNTPQGEIPEVNKMPSTLILYPRSGQKIKRNKPFPVTIKMNNFDAGFFSNATNQYNVFPQELNEEGVIQGHNHITIQFLGRNKESIPDATKFAFFKGLNGNEDRKGQLSVNVDIGLPKKGIYRICTMSASFAHTCLVLPKAQRGASDDCIRVYVY